MACGYTGRAAIGVGSMFVFTGAAMMVVRQASHKVIGDFAGALGILTIALLTYLTGVCANPAHSCPTT